MTEGVGLGMARIRKGIAVIGAGNWGSSLAAGVVAAGFRWGGCGSECAAAAGEVWRGCGGFVGEGEARRGGALDLRAGWRDCWSRRADCSAARRFARSARQVVVHSSGALTIAALDAARLGWGGCGRDCSGVQFSDAEAGSHLRDVLFAVEGRRRQARRLAALVRKLGGKPLRISFREQGLVPRGGDDGFAVAGERVAGGGDDGGVGGVRLARGGGGGAGAGRDCRLRNFFSEGARAELQWALRAG